MPIDRRRIMAIGLSAAAAVGASRLAAQAAWLHYANDRYGFSIDYPPQFRSDPPPENGDGLHFRAPDGAEFTASAIRNMSASGDSQSLAEYETSLRQGDDYAQVTYRAAAGSTLVLSGYRGNSVFYEKHVLSQRNQLANSFSITYPASRKMTYDGIVARMAQSFRPGTPEGNWD